MSVPGAAKLKVLNTVWMERMLYHSEEAILASNKWQAAKQRVTEYIATNKQNFPSAEQRRDKYKLDWGMQDAMDAWSWHERQSKLYAANLAGLNAYICNQNLLHEHGGI